MKLAAQMGVNKRDLQVRAGVVSPVRAGVVRVGKSMGQLEEAVLDVLVEAKRNGECLGVAEISRRAGIWSGSLTQEAKQRHTERQRNGAAKRNEEPPTSPEHNAYHGDDKQLKATGKFGRARQTETNHYLFGAILHRRYLHRDHIPAQSHRRRHATRNDNRTNLQHRPLRSTRTAQRA